MPKFERVYKAANGTGEPRSRRTCAAPRLRLNGLMNLDIKYLE